MMDRDGERTHYNLQHILDDTYPTTDEDQHIQTIIELIAELEQEIEAKKVESLGRGITLNLLIQFIEAPEEGKKSLLSRFIKEDDRIINYILGFNLIDTKIEPFTELIRARTDLDELQLPEEQKSKIDSLINRRKLTDGTKCFLHGPYGVGKKTVAQCMCKELGMALLTVDIAYLVNKEVDFEDIIARLFREAELQAAAVYLAHFDQLYSEDTKNVFYKNILVDALENCSGITFIASEEPLELSGGFVKKMFDIEIPVLDYAMRKTIWEQYLTVNFSEDDISALANKFKFTACQIKDAIASARKLAVLDEREEITLKYLYDGCRAQSNQKLTALAKRIKSKYHWDDLILPKEKKEQLQEVKNYIKNKSVVYHDWDLIINFRWGRA